MKIAIVGGGPGGLYLALLTKKARPDWQIDVYEQNRADDTFGFGVVFSDETLEEFLSRDAAILRHDQQGVRLLGRHRHPLPRAAKFAAAATALPDARASRC